MNILEEARNERRVVREWTHADVECFMALSPSKGVNGYVRLPSGMAVTDELDEAAPGGITYGPDRAGWIGFDTAHGFDAWLDPDVPEGRVDRYMRELREREPGGWPEMPLPDPAYMNIWTLEKVEEAVNELATAVAVGSRNGD